jgi:leucyl-tRNA synthetase
LPNWPEKVKTMQENWIGRSEGAEVDFTLENSDKSIRIFTTRPETLFGASFVAVSYAHPIALGLTETEAKDFIKECEKGSTKAEDIETAEKKGFFTGLYAINPLNQERIPVYIANFVLMEYGTGAIFGCPAHDERDHVFAIKYNLPIKQVVSHPINSTNKHDEDLNGKMINSGELDDLSCIKAREKMFIKFGRKVNFRLKDWGVSRQRYWGCPIPVINCPKCKSVPVPESQLPVELPDDVKMEAGENPLKTHPTWRFVNCPNCGGKAERETDTLDTFFESSWYFLRFSGNGGSEKAFINPIKVNDYVGGIEHAILHLLYARFFTRALKKCGYPVSFEEPFERLITQGMVCHKTFQTLEGKWLTPKEASTTPPNLYTIGASIKMSKSKKNVIEPAVIVEEFGADASRLFISSDTPPERDMEWNDEGVVSSGRFLNKLFLFAQSLKDVKAKEPSVETLKILHKSIFEYEKEIEAIAFNKAIAKIRELSNQMFSISLEEAKYVIEYLTIMLLPFCPHISCEIADILNFNINSFPIVNKKFLEDKTCTISIQINGKLRGTINVSKGIPQEEISKLALLEESIKKHIAEKEIKKIIFVQDKIINFVI